MWRSVTITRSFVRSFVRSFSGALSTRPLVVTAPPVSRFAKNTKVIYPCTTARFGHLHERLRAICFLLEENWLLPPQR